MWRFIALRTLQAIPVILTVITVTFFLVRAAPGGPFASEKAVLPQVQAALEARYRLDQPMLQQYFSYLSDMVHGDLGPTFKYPGRSVDELILDGLPITAELYQCEGHTKLVTSPEVQDKLFAFLTASSTMANASP